MEVKIGIQQAARELIVEVDHTADEVAALVSEALGSEAGFVSLADSKGRRVLVPAAKLAYVEIGASTVGAVGFRS